MQLMVNILFKIWTRITVTVYGILAFLRLVGMGLSALMPGQGSVGSRIGAKFASPQGLLQIFAFLRSFLPNVSVKFSPVKAYENTGTAIVTRAVDVAEVLNREQDFEVVYEPRMREITDGANFFLGMQDSWEYTRDTSNMHLAMRRSDVAEHVKPVVAEFADAQISGKKQTGEIDVPQDLTLLAPTHMVATYFGTPGPSPGELIEWTTKMFWYLFIDLGANPDVTARAAAAATRCRAYLDGAIAERKIHPVDTEDVLNRCLALQQAKTPGMDDLDIRNNLIGLIIGAIPTISRAAIQSLDQLLLRPDQLGKAQEAARSDDDDLLSKYIFEAFRFNPINPVIFRRAVRDATIAKGTFRACKIKKGRMVMASNLSAMFDPYEVNSPNEFRLDRPWQDYILWGYGMHACFGAHINHAVIPAILKPLLKLDNLRRAEGASGRIDTEGTPFPVHMHLMFDSQ